MNDLIYVINKCETDEEVKEIMDFAIEEFTKRSKERNRDHDTIGRMVGINPRVDLLGGANQGLRICNRWVGYIPRNVKVVYQSVDHNGVISNDGGYYYMGDESYVYEFCNFIKGKEYSSPVSFIKDVYRFMQLYFGNAFSPLDRALIHKMLEDKNGFKIGPVREHYLSGFKGTGAAMCTEMSAMGQNLMTLFGLNTEMVMDHHHAYNTYFYGDKVYIVDFQNKITVYDVHLREKECLPFMEEIHDFSYEMYRELFLNDHKIRMEDYSIVSFPHYNKVVSNERYRVYRADGKQILKKELK